MASEAGWILWLAWNCCLEMIVERMRMNVLAMTRYKMQSRDHCLISSRKSPSYGDHPWHPNGPKPPTNPFIQSMEGGSICNVLERWEMGMKTRPESNSTVPGFNAV